MVLKCWSVLRLDKVVLHLLIPLLETQLTLLQQMVILITLI